MFRDAFEDSEAAPKAVLFDSPRISAAQVAAMATAAERLAFIEKIPGAWRDWIIDVAIFLIAQDIAELEQIEQRRAALLEVPGEWRNRVMPLVASFWKTRYLKPANDGHA